MADDGTIVYDSDAEASVAVQTLEHGVRMLTVLDSPEAPSSYDYDIELPEGAWLELALDGGVDGYDADGELLLSVDIPWAIDADGKEVPTHYEIAGPTLTQVVDHRGSDFSYPITADPSVGVTYYEYKYVNIVKTSNWTNKGQQLAICKVQKGASGGTCTISESYESKTEIGISFDLSKATVGTGINISSSKTVKGSVSWTSPKASAGSSFKAWAVGTRVTYKIQQWKVHNYRGVKTQTLQKTSATLTAFSPVKGFTVGQ